MRQGPLADEAASKDEAAKERAYASQVKEDLRWLVQDKRGRRILGRMIFDVCGVMYGPPWNPSADIHRVAGRREVGEDLLRNLEDIEPHSARAMVNEWFADRNDRRISVRRLTTDEESA